MYLKTVWPQLKKFSIADVLTFGFLGIFVYLLFYVGLTWKKTALPSMQIDLKMSALPLYASFSMARAFLALILSIVFSLVYGTVAATNRKAEKWMIPILDILQSVPVLGFLPGLAIVMMALFPNSRIGLELMAILMIFTSQVWNMTFSIYQSAKQTPQALKDISNIYGLKFLRKFFWVQVPFGMIPLVWNAMMSVAGGWFFLMICESFVLKGKDFRLPGLGAYMSVAINHGDKAAIAAGGLTMLALILLLEVFLWRPLMSWASRFKWETVQTHKIPEVFIYRVLKKSTLLDRLMERFFFFINRMMTKIDVSRRKRETLPLSLWKAGVGDSGTWGGRAAVPRVGGRGMFILFFTAFVILSLLGFGLLISLLISIDFSKWLEILRGAGLTSLRVFVSLALASLWAIPLGILIGFFPKITRWAQPLVQIAAAFPMPMLFPLVLIGLHTLHVGMGWGSIILLTLALQWYLLFNTIAGAASLPQGFKELSTTYRLPFSLQMKKIILPALFPFLVTGWITAAGAGWNAAIVAEYIPYRGEIFTTMGLGSIMSRSAAHEDYVMLTAALVVMVLFVIGFNRLFWKKISELAETRFS